MAAVVGGFLVPVLISGTLLFSSETVLAQFTQQGPALVGTGYVAASPEQGFSVALSPDGNTALVGGPGDIDPVTMAQTGAVWIFTQSNGVWTQQGPKLVGTCAPGDAEQGASVALSADGNTALVGGPADDATTGAAWVFTRSGGVWTQQGPKLVGTGAVGLANQGTSVSLSSDGNTAIVGGPSDNNGIGAAWVFTRSGGVWSQQGNKLVGTAGIDQGTGVILSSDGTTAFVGIPNGNGWPLCPYPGAWIFVLSSGVWTQQGMLPVQTFFGGTSFAVSADGNTAAMVASNSTLVYARVNGVWSLQQQLFVSPSFSVALSADGNILINGSNGGPITHLSEKMVRG
jgi:hypothetical protein